MDHLQRGTTSINYIYNMNQDTVKLTIYDVCWYFIVETKM